MNCSTQKSSQRQGNEPGHVSPHARSHFGATVPSPSKKATTQRRVLPFASAKGLGCERLPTVGATLSATVPSLLPPAPPGIKEFPNTATTTTNQTDQTRRGPALLETMALHLMKASLNRQSNVFPVFLNDQATNKPQVFPKNEGLTLPERRLLMTPALGIAAGANAICGHSGRFVMSRKDEMRYLEQERATNRVIFSWWDERNACHQKEEEIAIVENELRSQLWNFFRQKLTEEEVKCLKELKQLQGATLLGQVMPGSTILTKKKGLCFEGTGPSPNNFLSSDRGISMPLEFYERLFAKVISCLHRYLLMILRCQAEGTGGDAEVSLQSLIQGNSYVQFLFRSQLEIVDAATKLSHEETGVMCSYPPVVSIPEERCFRPLLAIETAYSVTLLWRILDQTKALVPGIAWAHQLFTQYVLPHVYENFISYKEHFPKVGSIAEQVEQLHTIPLNILRQRAMVSATTQARGDLEYMQGFMKSWSWRTWRGSVVLERRRNALLMMLEKMFVRFHNVRRLQKSFYQWRVTAKEGQFSAHLDTINTEYKSFVSNARHAAREIQLFPELSEDATCVASYLVSKNKFVAMKLAETAQHVKSKKKSLSSEFTHNAEAKENSAEKNNEGLVLKKQDDALKLAPEERPCKLLARQNLEKQLLLANKEKSEETTQTGFKPAEEATFMTSFLCTESEGGEAPSAKERVISTFYEVFAKLQEMESISGYLRQEIAIQNSFIKRLEQENKSLKDKVCDLDEALLSSEKKRLHTSNVLQERELDIQGLKRRIAQLKSRVRCQKHRPWQRTFMRVLGEVCGASTATSENADELRIIRDQVSTHANTNTTDNNSDRPSTRAETVQPTRTRASSIASNRSTNTDATSDKEQFFCAYAGPGRDEERIFGQLAPLVLSSTRSMPNAQTILCDWANNCLEDMESLDDLRGGALSSRFYQFSDEIRNGVLFSRLLFYLALPRYQNKTAVAQTAAGETRSNAATNIDFTEHRRRLLMQKNVQLESPFPTYSECFGDLLNIKPLKRMSLLLRFATELIDGPEQLGDEYVQKYLVKSRSDAQKAINMTPLPAVDRVELQEVIDPCALARGDRCATITFIALLYVRFAHPFNHKARQSAMIEREAMLELLSNGTYSRSDIGVIVGHHKDTDSTEKPQGEEDNHFVAQKLFAQLEDEEQSPWQLFLKYCQPLISTMAHPFILRGNFWPSVAFESSTLAQLLGSLGLALHRSLEKHRWHIIISCLVPVNTYSGLSRGIFTGRRACSTALQVGLERESEWVFAMDMPCVQTLLKKREVMICGAIEKGILSDCDIFLDQDWRKKGHIAAMDKSRLMNAFSLCGADILQLFLQRCTLSASCSVPILDLGGWRMLWIDLGLVNPDDTEKSLLDLEQITRVFFEVLSLYTEWIRNTRDHDFCGDAWGFQQLPNFTSELHFPEFIVALLLLAHELFPPVSVCKSGKTGIVLWTADALSQLMFKHVTPQLIMINRKPSDNFVQSIRCKTKAHQVLMQHNKALLALFNSYCKDSCGVPGLEKENVLQMLRDAMLTSTDISQSLIYELFQSFSVTKKADDVVKEEKLREIDARLRDMATQRRRANVSILDPSPELQALPGKQKEHTVLLYDGFVEFLCVLCHFKQPNPLIPFEERLELFLRRYLLRPFYQRNDGLSAVMASEQRVK